MKGFKTGYVFVMTALLVLTIAVGIAAFYPAPKKYNYPTYPTSAGVVDYNSPEYKMRLEQYDKDQKAYQEANKKTEGQRRIWSQYTFIISLLGSLAFLIAGVMMINRSSLLGVSLLFASFILLVSWQALIGYYADSSYLSFGQEPDVDLSTYKQMQFGILLVGSILGVMFGINKPWEKYLA